MRFSAMVDRQPVAVEINEAAINWGVAGLSGWEKTIMRSTIVGVMAPRGSFLTRRRTVTVITREADLNLQVDRGVAGDVYRALTGRTATT